MMLNIKNGIALAMTLLVACASEADTKVQDGNAALGISKFQADETALKTTVVGLDSAGREVARLDLEHGPITLEGMFAEDHTNTHVDGRKLDVTIYGIKHLSWMTEGFSDTSQMPAHPAKEVELATFLADPHVKPVLDQWLIGFEEGAAPAAAGELAFTSGGQSGTSGQQCAANPCGTANNGHNINLCGGPGTSIKTANKILTTGVWKLAQCCFANAYVPYFFFGIKTCNPTSNYSTCGDAGDGACAVCPGYPVASSVSACDVITQPNMSATWMSWTY